MKVILPVFYLPPLSWFSVFLNEETDIVLEQFENFPKQTYRSRTVIYGANGKLSLTIPIQHNGERAVKNIQICERENWRNLHWKSIKTVYQRSPYFEFYEDRLQKIFTVETNSLLEFNLNALKILQEILQSAKKFTMTQQYESRPEAEDLREKFNAKKDSEAEMENYYQCFTEKYGFLKDLSIIDLICNKGPESNTYLKNIRIK